MLFISNTTEGRHSHTKHTTIFNNCFLEFQWEENRKHKDAENHKCALQLYFENQTGIQKEIDSELQTIPKFYDTLGKFSISF